MLGANRSWERTGVGVGGWEEDWGGQELREVYQTGPQPKEGPPEREKEICRELAMKPGLKE